jgi:hypothetical protein
MDANHHERPVPENEPPTKRARLNNDEDDESIPYLFLPFAFEATFWLWTPPLGPEGEKLKALVFNILRKKKFSSLLLYVTNLGYEEDLVKDFPEVAAFADRGQWDALLSVGSVHRVNAVLYEE